MPYLKRALCAVNGSRWKTTGSHLEFARQLWVCAEKCAVNSQNLWLEKSNVPQKCFFVLTPKTGLTHDEPSILNRFTMALSLWPFESTSAPNLRVSTGSSIADN
jgi:hypothetical protein